MTTAARPAVSVLRESFSAINTRFHLVGIYALAELLVRFAGHWTGTDPAGFPLVFASLMLYVVTSSGIFGLLFEAAMGPRETLHFLQWAVGLFLPVLWLLFKIGFVQLIIVTIAAAVVQLTGGQSFQAAFDSAWYWGTPAVNLVAVCVALYSVPVTILSRVRRVWRPAIASGLRLYRISPGESARLLMVLAIVVALDSGLHFALGTDADKAPPGYLEGIIALVSAYLTLVALYGGMRVVLLRLPAGPADRKGTAAGPAA